MNEWIVPGTPEYREDQKTAAPKAVKTSVKSKKSEIDEDIKYIMGATRSMEFLGWFWILICVCLIPLGDPRDWYLYYLVILGGYLIFAGKYIRYGLGVNIKRHLLIAGYASLLGGLGIIPLIASVQAFKSNAKFKRLPPKNQKALGGHNTYKIRRSDIVLITIAVLLLAGSIYARVLDDKPISLNNGSTSNQASLYTSTSYHFSINYPGSVSAKGSSTEVSGMTVPYAYYSSSIDSGNEVFIVYAYDYPTANFNFSGATASQLQNYFSDSAAAIVKGYSGKLISTMASSFLGYKTSNSKFTITDSSTTVTGYLRIFFVGNREYALISAGSSINNFNNFANSFKYIN